MLTGVRIATCRPLFPFMQFKPSNRATKAAIAASIVMLLVAMLLPVCHLHPLLDKGAPDHCTICVSLHAAAPLVVHVPAAVALMQTDRVFIAPAPVLRVHIARFAPTRAPPLSAC